MEDQTIKLSQLNDFVFCPASIYFHNLYGDVENRTFQRTDQVKGKVAHEAIDEGRYSTRKDVLMGIDVFSEEYGITGKIDVFDKNSATLIERKRKVRTVYDGYVFQLYGQYFCLTEMGYVVKHLRIYSLEDNKVHKIPLPKDNPEMLKKFTETIQTMRDFDLDDYHQENAEKCKQCIYEPACDRGLV